jgi:hypothetical protein
VSVQSPSLPSSTDRLGRSAPRSASIDTNPAWPWSRPVSIRSQSLPRSGSLAPAAASARSSGPARRWMPGWVAAYSSICRLGSVWPPRTVACRRSVPRSLAYPSRRTG